MLSLAIIIVAFEILRRQLAALSGGAVATLAPRKIAPHIAQMSTYADRLFAEKKWLAAEKAYLALLKVDHKHVTAYTHLGIIYTTQKNFADAIECFVIATRLRPAANSYQNLGLAYFDNKNYIKSIAAFEKSIMFEPTASRYVSLAKAQGKLHNQAASVTALEKAVELDPSKRILVLLAEAYTEAEQPDAAREVFGRIHELDPSDKEAARKIGVFDRNVPIQ